MPCPPRVNVLGEDGAVDAVAGVAVAAGVCANMQASAVIRPPPTPPPNTHTTHPTSTDSNKVTWKMRRRALQTCGGQTNSMLCIATHHWLCFLLQASVAAFSSGDQSVIPYKSTSMALKNQHSAAQHTCTLDNQPGPINAHGIAYWMWWYGLGR